MRKAARIRPGWLALSAMATLALAAVFPAASVAQQLGCAPTRPDVEGPFYKPNAPDRASTGSGFVVSGTIRSATGCGPLAGARIEWWSVNSRGTYDDAHRAAQRADGDGRFRYETDFPMPYFGRPPHLHIRITAPGHRTLITQLYPTPGQTRLNLDFVLVRE